MATTYTYGVFKTHKALADALTELKANGLEGKVSGMGTSTVLLRPAVNPEPLRQHFIMFGAIGAVIGGLAGALALPATHYTYGYQVMTPMMAMVTGALLCAYFGIWIFGVLNGLEGTDDHAESVQNPDGNALVLTVMTATREAKRMVMDTMERNDSICIVVRDGEIGPMETISVAEQTGMTKTESGTQPARLAA